MTLRVEQDVAIQIRGSQLILASYENDSGRFYEVLKSGPISKEDLGGAVIAVAYKSHARMIQILSNPDTKYPCIQKENVEMLLSLLERLGKGELSCGARSRALFASVMSRNVQMTQILLEDGPVDLRYLQESIHEAHRGRQDIETSMNYISERIAAKL